MVSPMAAMAEMIRDPVSRLGHFSPRLSLWMKPMNGPSTLTCSLEHLGGKLSEREGERIKDRIE